MEEDSVMMPEGSLAFQQLLQICADTFIEAKRNELAHLKGRAIHEDPNPHYVDTMTGAPKQFVSLGDQLAEPPQPTPSLTEVMDKFLANPNKHRTKKTKDSIRGYLAVVFHVIGDNTPVSDISEGTIEEVRDLIMRLPPNFKKLPNAERYTFHELADVAERKGMAKLSPTGVNNYLRWLMTFLAWCHRKGMMDRMPTAYAEIKVADAQIPRHRRTANASQPRRISWHHNIPHTQHQ